MSAAGTDEARPVPTRAQVWVGRAARAVSGLAVLGLTVVVVVAGARAPGEGPNNVATTVVSVPPTASTLVCAGPLIQPDDTGRGDSAFDPTPVEPVTTLTVVTSVPDRDGSSVTPVGPSSVTCAVVPVSPGARSRSAGADRSPTAESTTASPGTT